MAHAWTICREVDLARDFVGVERIAALATTSAKAAHELHIAVKSGGVSIGTDGASVALNLILPDGISTMADGSIESGECIATLPPLCYQRGETRGVLLLQFGTQAAIPVYAFVLRCFEDLTDVFADPDHVIPSLAELLAQLAAAKAAAKAAQDGASAANAAAGSANAAAEDAAAAAEDAAAAAKGADDAASAANAAAQTANAAAARLDGLTATATGLDAGSAPTLDVSTGEDGAKRLAFGIPKGDKGDTGATPNLAITVKTGEPGTEASTVQGGTPENPTLEITIPRGNTGDIGALTINGQTPDASGAVTLMPEDLGAATAEEVSSLKGDIDGLSDAIANAGGVKTVAGVGPDSAGNVALTAENVGARPSSWMPTAAEVGALAVGGTAADSSKLGSKTLAEIMLALYPVGAIYISAVSTSPASLFGGTWTQLTDRFLLGAGNTYGAGSAGGEATHTLTRNEIPNYKIGDLAVMVPALHGNWSNGGISSSSLGDVSNTKPGLADKSNNSITSGIQYGYQIDSYGGGSAHNNMPPYLAVYMWKRVN